MDGSTSVLMHITVNIDHDNAGDVSNVSDIISDDVTSRDVIVGENGVPSVSYDGSVSKTINAVVGITLDISIDVANGV